MSPSTLVAQTNVFLRTFFPRFQPVIRLYRVPFDAFDPAEDVEDEGLSAGAVSDDGGL